MTYNSSSGLSLTLPSFLVLVALSKDIATNIRRLYVLGIVTPVYASVVDNKQLCSLGIIYTPCIAGFTLLNFDLVIGYWHLWFVLLVLLISSVHNSTVKARETPLNISLCSSVDQALFNADLFLSCHLFSRWKSLQLVDATHL